jgi:hypothetical protein
MDFNQQFLDKTMNRAQLRACRAVLRHTKDMSAGLVMARRKGWLPDGKKAETSVEYFRPRKKGLHINKNDRALAMSLGVGRGPDTEHARPSQADKNKKHRLRRALRKAGWVLG